MQMPAWWVLLRTFFLAHGCLPFCCILSWYWERESSSVSLSPYKGAKPIMGAPHLWPNGNPIISLRPHFLITITLGVRDSTYTFLYVCVDIYSVHTRSMLHLPRASRWGAQKEEDCILNYIRKSLNECLGPYKHLALVSSVQQTIQLFKIVWN